MFQTAAGQVPSLLSQPGIGLVAFGRWLHQLLVLFAEHLLYPPSIFPSFPYFFSNLHLSFLFSHSWPETRGVIMKRRKRAAQQRKKLRNSTSSARDQQLMSGRRRMAALDACLPQRTSAGQRLCTDSCFVWFSKTSRREKGSSGKCVSSNMDQVFSKMYDLFPEML